MIDPELKARIRRLHYAEHWKIGTIARQLRLHHDTVRRALQSPSSGRGQKEKSRRPGLTDPYEAFIRQTLERYPRLRATRIFQMIRARGYPGSVITLRRLVAVSTVKQQISEANLIWRQSGVQFNLKAIDEGGQVRNDDFLTPNRSQRTDLRNTHSGTADVSLMHGSLSSSKADIPLDICALLSSFTSR